MNGYKTLKTKKELSNATRYRVLRNGRTMFSDAVTWELISKNPFKSVKSPKCSVSRWHYLKSDEYARLLKAAPSLRWKAFYALAYTAGLRLGELVNLIWADHLPPNTTKELAGHSSLETTLRYYNQVDDYHRAKAAEIMEPWLNRKIS